jgi:RNA polymerase sigma factor (sigma-70 family)
MRAEDRLEFEWLFRSAFPRIKRTVALMLRDDEAAEDVAQEAFLKLHQHWHTVSGYEHPDAWVRRVAIRLAVRQAKREQGLRLLQRVAQPTPAARPEPDVDLADAIAALAPMQRAAVVLFYFDDLPVSDIARTLVVSESTVKQHLHRARARLAAALSKEGEHVD